MNKFLHQITLVTILIGMLQACKYKVEPKFSTYKLTITKIKMASSATGYDTVWYETDRDYDPNMLVDVYNENSYNSSSSSYANPEVVKRTKEYILLNRNIDNYNGNITLKLQLIGYGQAFEPVSVAYISTTNNNGSTAGLGKILFKTSSEWVLWDLEKKQKVRSYTSSSIVDYNYTLGNILYKSGATLYIYDEDFDYYLDDIYSDYISNGTNFHMAGADRTIGFFENYRTSGLGEYITPSGYMYSKSTSGYTNYQFHSNGSSYSLLNYVYNQYSSPLYRLTYTLASGSTGTAKTSGSGFYDFEISRNGRYIAYVDMAQSNLLSIFDTSTLTTDNSVSGITNSGVLAINDKSTHVAYVKGSLQLYDLSKKTTSSPLAGTAYATATISQIFW